MMSPGSIEEGKTKVMVRTGRASCSLAGSAAAPDDRDFFAVFVK
jgi:hypothetical protein